MVQQVEKYLGLKCHPVIRHVPGCPVATNLSEKFASFVAEGLLDPLLPNILLQPEQESEVKTGTDEDDQEVLSDHLNQISKKERNKAVINVKDSVSRSAEQEK